MPYTVVDKGSKYFNTKTYTGTNSTLSITGVGFQPDWVWIKSRSDAVNHVVFDVVRGVYNILEPNTTNAETNSTASLTSFDADGFTLGTGSGRWNNNASTYVSWCWDANGTGVSNTAGTITSTVSANTTSGFSIVSYTGTATNATVGHGLGVAPSMIIVKKRGGTSNWNVYHKNLTSANYYLILNDASAQITTNDPWNNTAPTSTVFSIKGTAGDVNTSATTHIAYCFAEVKGYSKFGKYTGNGSTDGTFVYTGFSPAFVLIKNTTAANSWVIKDSKRPSYNPASNYVYAQATNIEATDIPFDFLSNGFKTRATGGDTNNGTYIYMAFAENPFVSSKSIPTTAR